MASWMRVSDSGQMCQKPFSRRVRPPTVKRPSSGSKKGREELRPNATSLRPRCGKPSCKPGHHSVEELWVQFFSNPSEWWDHTAGKVHDRYPDFKHKKTGVALWMNGKWNPAWVSAELASMIPGSVSRSIFSWNAMISGCVKSGRGHDALELYNHMQVEGVKPDPFTFVGVLNACANLSALEIGRRIHTEVIGSGFESHVFVGNSLVDMYGKCGSIEDAWKVFHEMPTHTVVSWNSMLAGYVKCNEGWKAIKLFHLMELELVKPNSVTFAVVLSACASSMALEEGRLVHLQVIQNGCESDVFVGNTLIDMYSKCGSIDDAWKVFCCMSMRNVVSWNALLAGYLKCEQGQKALDIFLQMQAEGVMADRITFVLVLSACASGSALEEGRHIHTLVVKCGCGTDLVLGNALVDMYGKCGSIKEARKVFQEMPSRDVVSWSAMLAACLKCEEDQKVLELFAQMQEEGLEPDSVTIVLALNACASIMALEEGKHVHAQVIRSGFEFDVFVGTALVDMYAKCGSIDDAERVFQAMCTRDVVCWNSLLGGFAMHGHGKKALLLFQDMCQAGVKMNMATFVCLLSACSHGGLVEEGIGIFDSMGPMFGVSPNSEHYICIVDLLGRAGRLDEAENMVRKESTISKDVVALMTLLSACRNHGNLEMGERIAQQILEIGAP